MNVYTKIVPLLFLMASSTTILADTISDEATKKNNKEMELKKLEEISIPKIAIDFKDIFVNVEINEIVIKNTKRSMSEIEDAVKSAKDEVALNSLFSSVGTVTAYKSYIFNNAPLYTDNYFKNSHVRTESSQIEKLDNKNLPKTTVYNTNSDYSYYSFRMYISQLASKDLKLSIEGATSNDYGTTIDPSVKETVSTETNNIKNTFNQNLGMKMDKYTILTSFSSKDETRLLIGKITESN